MANVMFFEKPGCINNTKQKALLKAAGHRVDARNLLTEPWATARLRCFFGDRPVVDWFNPTAPAIKAGCVHPDHLEPEAALELMLQDPLLIRRPLLQIGDRCEVGFDIASIERWIGLKVIGAAQQHALDSLMRQDLQTCPNSN